MGKSNKQTTYRFAVSKNRHAFEKSKYAADIMEEYYLTTSQMADVLRGECPSVEWANESHPGFIKSAIQSLAGADDDCYVVNDFYDPDPSTPFDALDDASENAGVFAAQDTFNDPHSTYQVKMAWMVGCGKVVQVGAPRIALRVACRKAGVARAVVNHERFRTGGVRVITGQAACGTEFGGLIPID